MTRPMQIAYCTGAVDAIPAGAGEDRRFWPVEAPAPGPGLNRELRRLQKRTKRKPPAPRRKDGLVMVNAADVAKARATRLTDAERAHLLQPARDGFKALREGVATYRQWVEVNTVNAVAMAIETQGVIRGMHEHFAAADRALDAIYDRVQAADGGPAWGKRTTLYFDEIAALREAIHLHEEQLRVLAAFELEAATRLAIKRNHAIGSGRATQEPTQHPQPVQETLL